MKINKNLARNLRTFREISGKSITDFADELGISKSSLQNICSGNCNLRMDTITQIAESLGIDPMALLLDSYSTNQFAMARSILGTLDAYLNLPEEERDQAVQLFQQLVMRLDNSDASQSAGILPHSISSDDRE